MVSIGSPLMAFYLSSIVSNIVSFTVFVMFNAEVLWPRFRTIQGYPQSKVTMPIDSTRDFLFDLYWHIIVSVIIIEIFDVKCFLTLNFIQGQWSWCKLEAHWCFPIRPPSCPILYLSRYSRYLMWKLCDLDLGLLKISTWVTSYSDFYWPEHRTCHRLWNLTCSLMTLN